MRANLLGSDSMDGRRAQAARNDTAILEAARAVYAADPEAPIAAVAARAGVGISALYRRYPSKEELLRKLCGDGLRESIAAAEAALADDGDAWKVFRRYMTRVVEADAHTLSFRLAIALEKDSEALWQDATKAQDLRERVFKRAQKGGAVRADAVAGGHRERLRAAVRDPRARARSAPRSCGKRYLTLQLDGLRPRKKAQPAARARRRACGTARAPKRTGFPFRERRSRQDRLYGHWTHRTPPRHRPALRRPRNPEAVRLVRRPRPRRHRRHVRGQAGPQARQAPRHRGRRLRGDRRRAAHGRCAHARRRRPHHRHDDHRHPQGPRPQRPVGHPGRLRVQRGADRRRARADRRRPGPPLGRRRRLPAAEGRRARAGDVRRLPPPPPRT